MLHDFILYNKKVVCPRCDGNGFLYMAIIELLSEHIIICDECEALWFVANIQSINKTNYTDFTTYVQNLGYTYDEMKLIAIDYDWYFNKNLCKD